MRANLPSGGNSVSYIWISMHVKVEGRESLYIANSTKSKYLLTQ